MSDRIYLVCTECSDKKVIAKRFSRSKGWMFACFPEGGIPVINADSRQELESQIEVGGLNCPEKEDVVMVAAFNKWLAAHKCCKDFSIEVEA